MRKEKWRKVACRLWCTTQTLIGLGMSQIQTRHQLI